MSPFRIFFQTVDGTVLVSEQSYETAMEADEQADEIMLHPEDFDLLDPEGNKTDASLLDPTADYSIEQAADEDFEQD